MKTFKKIVKIFFVYMILFFIFYTIHFCDENGETMIFDTTSEVRNYHDRAVQELLSQLPAANPFG